MLKIGPTLLHNIIGPVFNTTLDQFLTTCFCFFVFFLPFFFLGGGGTGFFLLKSKKGKAKKTQKKQIRRVSGQVRWPFGPPHLSLKPSKKTRNKQIHKNIRRGQVRWPFGPPHLTLKPFQKNKKKQEITKKNNKNNPTTKQKQNQKTKNKT